MDEVDDQEPAGEPFAIADLWRKSIFTQESEGVFKAYDTEFPIHDGKESPLTFELKTTLEYPDLGTFPFGPIDAVSAPESLAPSIDVGDVDSLVFETDDDIWKLVLEDEPIGTIRGLRSWEYFNDHGFREPLVLLSEAGPSAFDAARQLLISPPDQQRSALVFIIEPLLKAVLQLGLGIESVFFTFQDDKSLFCGRLQDFTITGYSAESTKSLVSRFETYGNQFRALRSFVSDAYMSKKTFPTMIAVAETISSILDSLTRHLLRLSPSPRSFLQLLSAFERPGQLLGCIHNLTAKICKAGNDEEALSILYVCVEDTDCNDNWMRPIMLQVLAHVSQPWLELLSIGIGLHHELSCNDTRSRRRLFEGLSTDHEDDSNINLRLPKFITKETEKMILNTYRGLKLVEAHTPDHLLARTQSHLSNTEAQLEWQFSWTDIERIQAKARDYEAEIMKVVNSHKSLAGTGLVETDGSDAVEIGFFDPFGMPVQTMESQITESINIFDSTPSQEPTTDNALILSLDRALMENHIDQSHGTFFDPPLGLASSMSFSPVISAQARLVNMACLRMLFREHSLRSHLSLQRRYYLFGDGVFATRLAHALFNPNLGSAERRKGHHRTGTMGLRLGSRDTWPPASSELRLALMGIITESYHGSVAADNIIGAGTELPGGLSFAIRDISEEEIQKCLDPNSIEALDFLCLQYKPPAPLDAVITRSSLMKYDMVFKLLLRMTRMLFVVNQFSRSAIMTRPKGLKHTNRVDVRFRIESHHFVSTLCAYFCDTILGPSWTRFEETLDHLEERLDDSSAYAPLNANEGIHRLRALHEHTLDSMMFALLLRKRQEQIMNLLLEIFCLILLYAKDTNAAAEDIEEAPGHGGVAELYRVFKEKVAVFIAVCKGLNERGDKASGQTTAPSFDDHSFSRSSVDSGENGIGQLLLKLDMNGFYSRELRT